VEDGVSGWVIALEGPCTDEASVAARNVGESGGAKVQSTALCMLEFIWFDSGDGCKLRHEKGVIDTLGSEPSVRFDSDGAVNIVEEFPKLREVAAIDVFSLVMSWLAEDWPGYSRL
jgi:hypothetical protein